MCRRPGIHLCQHHRCGYLYIKERAKEGKKWNSVIEHELDISSTKDRSKDNQMIEGDYNLYWGRYRHWQLFADRLLLQAGGLANANLGFLYDMTASNNPAQARISLNLMPAARTHLPPDAVA